MCIRDSINTVIVIAVVEIVIAVIDIIYAVIISVVIVVVVSVVVLFIIVVFIMYVILYVLAIFFGSCFGVTESRHQNDDVWVGCHDGRLGQRRHQKCFRKNWW